MNYSFIKKALAHGGEEHESKVESTVHFLDIFLNPYVAILALLIILAIIFFLLERLGMKFSSILLSLIIVDLILGIIGFLFVPPMGILAITIGFVGSIILVMSGISS